jgi:NTP pyrophosphatase (non-canonical NTP hydrolase)
MSKHELTLSLLQHQHRPWVAHNFPTAKPHHPLLGAMEELGELSRAHLKEELGIRGNPLNHAASARDAVGDIVIFLSCYCILRGFDFQMILEETWAAVKKRDWVKYPGDGVSR